MLSNEAAIRRMEEQLKRLPEDVQERVGYIIQGALLVQQSQSGAQPDIAYAPYPAEQREGA